MDRDDAKVIIYPFLDEAALRAAVEWSVRYLPDFRLPDKALDLVDQACAVVRFATLSPRRDGKSRGETPLGRPGARCSSHGVGVDDIARVVAARCGIPVGTLTADEGARLMALEAELGKRVKGVVRKQAMELILNAGFSEAYGARNLERTMDEMLGNKLAGMLLAEELAAGAVLRVAGRPESSRDSRSCWRMANCRATWASLR